MESPITLFLEWLNNEKTNPFTETICFLFLAMYPGYGIKKLSNTYGSDRFEMIKEFLSSIEDPKEIVGMSLSIEGIVSFILKDYGNIDSELEKMSMFNYKEGESEQTRKMLDEMKSNQLAGIQPRKDLKESWENLKAEFLNFEYLNRYLILHSFK